MADEDLYVQSVDVSERGMYVTVTREGVPVVKGWLHPEPVKDPQVAVVHMGDPDARAEAFNEGFETAIAQVLVAEHEEEYAYDWLQEQKSLVWQEAIHHVEAQIGGPLKRAAMADNPYRDTTIQVVDGEIVPRGPDKVPTLGDIAVILRELREVGVTYQSIQYVIGQVYWQEIEAEEKATAEMREAMREALGRE